MENSEKKWNQIYMRDTTGEAKTNSWLALFSGPLHMDVPVLTDQPELIYISFM